MSKELIFAVDDEVHIQQLIQYNLEAAGFKVMVFDSAEKLLEALGSTLPALFLLDIMLPGMDGLELCRSLRSNNKTRSIPIIMLTAKGEEFDKVLGLELGADDYLTKPFSVRELAARVKALLRRTAGTAPEETGILRYGDIELDTARHEVFKNGKLLEMPPKEFELLKLLMQNRGKVLTRELLLDKIWGYDYYGETRTVDVHIRYLRQKIEDDDNKPAYIETIRGIGYKFSDKEQVTV